MWSRRSKMCIRDRHDPADDADEVRAVIDDRDGVGRIGFGVGPRGHLWQILLTDAGKALRNPELLVHGADGGDEGVCLLRVVLPRKARGFRQPRQPPVDRGAVAVSYTHLPVCDCQSREPHLDQ